MSRVGAVAGVSVVLAALAGLALVVAPPEDSAAPGPGNGPAAPTLTPAVQPQARSLLERAADAPGQTAYTGTQYVSAWGDGVTSSRIVSVRHDPRSGTTWQPAGVAAGEPMHLAKGLTPSLHGAGAVTLLARHYALTVTGTGWVAGREADVVEARRPSRPSGSAVAGRFWLDRATGLVLRREVYDERGRPTRASAFVDIVVRRVQPPTPDGGASADGGGAPLDEAAVKRMRADGWTCPDRLPGPLTLADARWQEGTGALHLSYADGLASVSVFEQRGDLDEDRLRGYERATVGGRSVWLRRELPTRVVFADAGSVYTVVADASPRTVAGAVRVLGRGDDDGARAGDGGRGGTLDRLGRGLGRMASWFNPVD